MKFYNLKSRKLEDYPNASATEFIKDKVNKYDIVLVSIPNNQDSSINDIIKLEFKFLKYRTYIHSKIDGVNDKFINYLDKHPIYANGCKYILIEFFNKD